MMKWVLTLGPLLAIVLLSGCDRTEAGPRFQGRIVSHVDAYGSGTGNESVLHREGSMMSGFNYGDESKPDWTSDIKWCYLRQDGGSDVYQVEWTFQPKNGTGNKQMIEVFFDGRHSAKISGNQWQMISIEPTRPVGDSQPAAATDG